MAAHQHEETEMERVYVRLRPAELEAVKALSREERRHPSDQIALFVQEALRQRVQAAETQDTHRQPVEAGA